MHRLLIAAAPALVLALAPVAAHAQPEGVVNATPGALAGRSPHHAYRPATAASTCPTAMHSLPAGKLPVYGAAHLVRPGCEAATRVANTGASSVRAAR